MNNLEARKYLSRIARLKPEILRQQDLVVRIKGIFLYRYEEGSLVEGTYALGQGNNHAIYGIGSVKDPETEKDIFLALRIHRSYPIVSLSRPSPCDLGPLLDELSAYECAFTSGKNPPYFAGIVRVSFGNKNFHYSGIITEDISCGKLFTLEERRDGNVVRMKPDGIEELFYLDPVSSGNLSSAERALYLRKAYRIDVS